MVRFWIIALMAGKFGSHAEFYRWLKRLLFAILPEHDEIRQHMLAKLTSERFLFAFLL
jgi:hypothetical protein